MITRIVIKAWNDKPIPREYSKEEFEVYTKYGWEVLLNVLLLGANNCNDKFEIESVEVEE